VEFCGESQRGNLEVFAPSRPVFSLSIMYTECVICVIIYGVLSCNNNSNMLNIKLIYLFQKHDNIDGFYITIKYTLKSQVLSNSCHQRIVHQCRRLLIVTKSPNSQSLMVLLCLLFNELDDLL